MKIFEIKSVFRIIHDHKIWSVTCERSVLDPYWHITIANEKGASTSFTHFGPFNNDTVTQLLKDNLMFL